MHEFVGQEPATRVALRPELAGAEVDIAADGECASVERRAPKCCLLPGVDVHAAEVSAQVGLHIGSQVRWQRPSVAPTRGRRRGAGGRGRGGASLARRRHPRRDRNCLALGGLVGRGDTHAAGMSEHDPESVITQLPLQSGHR